MQIQNAKNHNINSNIYSNKNFRGEVNATMTSNKTLATKDSKDQFVTPKKELTPEQKEANRDITLAIFLLSVVAELLKH